MKKQHEPHVSPKYRAVAKLIGNQVRLRRLNAALTQPDLCVALGRKESDFVRISRIENATCRIQWDELFELADYFGCEARDLLPTMAEWREAAG